MRYRTPGIVLAFVALSAVTARPAGAATIVYTDLASFQAASTTTNIDFSGLAPDGSNTAYGTSPLIVGSVTFSSPEEFMFVIDADDPLGHAFPNSVAPATLFDNNVDPGDAFLIALGPVTAVGFDIANSSGLPNGGGFGGLFTVTLSTDFVYAFANTAWPNFFGFTTDQPVTQMIVNTSNGLQGNNHAQLTNFRYGDANATATVPEPTTLLLFGIGLAAAGVRRYRQRQK